MSEYCNFSKDCSKQAEVKVNLNYTKEPLMLCDNHFTDYKELIKEDSFWNNESD